MTKTEEQLRLSDISRLLGVRYGWLYNHQYQFPMGAKRYYDGSDVERLRTWYKQFQDLEQRKQSLVNENDLR